MHPFPWISWKQLQTHARAFGFSALSGFVGCQQEAWKSQVTDHLHVPHQKAEERASLESSKYRFCSVPSHCSWPDNLHLSFFFPHFLCFWDCPWKTWTSWMLRLRTHSLTQILLSLSDLYQATVTIIAFTTKKVIQNVLTISDTCSNPSKNYVLIVIKSWCFGGFW